MAKKEPIYRGLADLTVQIEDSSVASPDYFKIVNLPFEFTAGPNLFKFRGNASLFNENSEVYVEILDSNNDPIYHEVDLDEESDPKAAVVVVYINQDTAPGPAKIILCTSAYKDINNNLLDTSKINVRWTGAVYVDVSRINPAEIVFSKLPTINVTNSTGSYVNYGYALGERVVSQSVTGLRYLFSGRTPVLITGSNCTIGFTTSSLYASVDIPFTSGSSYYPSIPGTVATLFPSQSTQIYKSNIVGFNGKGIAYLQTPMTFELVNNNTLYRPNSVNIITASINYTQQNSSAESSQNTYNYATVFFSGLAPQIGIVAKIRSYYKSTGIGEYILSNETDILDQSIELGFTIDVVTASFALPTIQRNDRIDFKFEFVNPIGLVSKQYVESLNNLYLGGNTYIGGDDNLLTGSLFVAGATGTGVEITGKGSSAMVRSIGYQGFKNAIDNNGGQYSGFVIYSGSVQTILGANNETYSGVGLELVANSSSYFKYATANGGLLDIRTNAFFLGSSASYISSSNGNLVLQSNTFFLGNNQTFISGSDGNIKISGSNIDISTPSFLLGDKTTFISGSGGNIKISGSNIDISTSTFFLGNNQTFISGSGENIEISGSNVKISTPSFFFGNATTSISGSGGNISISGSNVKISTPSFILGVKGIPSSSYVSGSTGNLELYSNRFILTAAGIVTASGVFVPKAFFAPGGAVFTGVPSFTNVGYGTGIYPMIEPDNIFVDATNIGRVASPSDPTQYYRYFPSVTNSAVTSTIFKSCSFHTMANENAYVVSLHLRAQVFGGSGQTGGGAVPAYTGGGYIDSLRLLADVYYIQSSSLSGTQYGTYDNWTSYALNQVIFDLPASNAPGDLSAATTYDRVVTGRNLKQFLIPPAITGSGGQMQLRFKFRTNGGFVDTNGYLPDVDVYVKHIEVLTGRQIGLNFKNYVIDSPEYGSIKSVADVPPAITLAFGPASNL